ncbi:MAG: DUF4421 family protein [bacterium]
MFRKTTFLIITFLCSLPLAAQEGNLLQRIDNYLKQRYQRINYDTNYIGRPDYRWTIKARPKLSLFGVKTMSTPEDDEVMKTDLRSSLKGKVSFSLGYSGITLSASAKPEHLTRAEEQDLEIRFDVYTRKFGFETEFSLINSLEGTFLLETPTLIPIYGDSIMKFHIPRKFASQYNFFISGYYVFNHQRFSYPAAFTQSYIQKRSAGSIIAGANFALEQLSLGDSTNDTELYNVANAFLSVGVGYGYNFVLPHNWLLHVSAIPYLIVRNRAICRFAGNREEWQTEFPQYIIIARAAAIRSWDRWFTGLTTHFMYSHVGADNLIEINNRQWHIMAIVGFRL